MNNQFPGSGNMFGTEAVRKATLGDEGLETSQLVRYCEDLPIRCEQLDEEHVTASFRGCQNFCV